ncbi:MAG TPA: 4-hydroxy-tetrahydrodipicolinate reductase [Clostridia bacterium]|jgi:4-hydroxy-tetrahydrodipicolinate reductase|nr:4-hydroxy-tetrahydrodipicolinate reductase [Clostridia bacterium]
MKVILHGANGKMGLEVSKFIKSGYQNAEPYAFVDVSLENNDADKTYSDLAFVVKGADVIIDFSHHSATAKLCKYAEKTDTPLVIATTGHTEEELELIRDTAKKVPVFLSGNMSLGIVLLIELAKKAVSVMPDADVEIIETHHNKKLDAPSGTALMIANVIKEVKTDARFVYGREGNAKREPNDIGIHAVRLGGVIGDHEVIIGTDTQTITLKHSAHTRTLFAEGSLKAARFIIEQKTGLYNMKDMLTK